MVEDTSKTPASGNTDADNGEPAAPQPARPEIAPPKEIGGRPGPDPTRYGDWEKAGRCIDF